MKTVGWREWVSLPQLGIQAIKAKVDTGARTTALHACSVEPFDKDGDLWVRFIMHPKQDNTDEEIICEAPVKDSRLVTDSGGHQEERYVIETELGIAGETRTVEATLTNRETMLFRMLIGRTAMSDLMVNPHGSFLFGGDKTSPPQE